MTDDKALREKLEAMVKASWINAGKNSSVVTYKAVALDLLREKLEAEEPCVWTSDGGMYLCVCSEQQPLDDGGWVLGNRFCPGCGHPVQVKQKEDAHD